MREVERIDRICDLLKQIWKLNPDLRFFQLIDCMQAAAKNDLFYVEDTQTEKEFCKFLNQHNN